MKDSNTVYEEISQGQDILKVGSYEIPSRAYIGRFNFRGTDQQNVLAIYQVVKEVVYS